MIMLILERYCLSFEHAYLDSVFHLTAAVTESPPENYDIKKTHHQRLLITAFLSGVRLPVAQTCV